MLRIYIYVYICNTRRKDEAETQSLLDHFGHFDASISDAKAQVIDPRSLILRSLMLKPRFSICDIWCWRPDYRSAPRDANGKMTGIVIVFPKDLTQFPKTLANSCHRCKIITRLTPQVHKVWHNLFCHCNIVAKVTPSLQKLLLKWLRHWKTLQTIANHRSYGRFGEHCFMSQLDNLRAGRKATLKIIKCCEKESTHEQIRHVMWCPSL